MLRSKASAAARRVRAAKLRRSGFCLFLLALPASASSATLGKTYFFATRDACVASGAFTARECAAAFANARAQMRDKAPRFSDSSECRLHFRLCQISVPDEQAQDALSYARAEEAVYAPAALGVEMIASSRGVDAAPTLAVETPERLFPYFPVAKLYEGRSIQAQTELENAAILAPDHFVPFSKRKPFTGEVTFAAASLGAVGTAAAGDDAETREQRRLRLKSAPFVQ